MKWYKIFSIPARLFLTFTRDFKFLIIAIIAPLILLAVFSVSYKPETGKITLGLIDLTKEEISQIKVSNAIKKLLMDNIDNLKIIEFTSIEIAKEAFKKNRIDGLIVFPENLDEKVFLKISGIPLENPAEVTFYFDDTNKAKTSLIMAELESSVIKFSQTLGIEPAFLISKESFYLEKISEQNFWTAGIIGFSIFVLSLLFSISLISQEKNSGILETITSTSMTSFEIILGYFFGYLLIDFIQILILLFTYILFFKGILSISIIFIFIFMFLLSCCGSLLGIFISNLFTSTIRSFQFAVIIMLISLFISGIFWPTSTLPEAGKVISYIFPTSFAVEAIRSIVIKEINFTNLLPQFFILIGFSLLYCLLGILTVRRPIE